MSKYRETKAINYSLLKEFYHSLPRARNAWERMYDKEHSVTSKDYFIIGTLVDMLITEPDNIDNKFLLVDKAPPSPVYLALANETLRLSDLLYPDTWLNDDELKSVVLQARINIDFYPSWGDDAVMKNFNAKCTEYFEIATQAKMEKKVLYTVQMYETALTLKDSLVTGKYTSPYFDEKYKVFNKVVLYWTFEGVRFKSELDRVIINEETKEIIPVDIKTYNGDFVSNFYDFMYYLQGTLYTAPLTLHKSSQLELIEEGSFELDMETGNEGFVKYMNSITYNVAPYFIFLTVDTSGKNPPMPFKYWSNPIAKAHTPFSVENKRNSGLIYLDGWLTKAKELQRHIDEDNWTYPEELIENGYVTL